MSPTPYLWRRVEGLARAILQTVHGHRARLFSEPAAEGFCIYLSVADARALDESRPRQGDLAPVSQIRDGDTGTLWGLPFIADETIRPGRAFVGYRVAAPAVQP